MRKATFIMMLMAVSLNISATDCFKDGTQWICEASGTQTPEPTITRYVLFIEGDTLINDKSYMKLYRAGDETPEDKTLANCLRKEGDRIYFLPYRGATEEVLMYDFGMQVGESAEIGLMPYYWTETSKAVMTTVKCTGYSSVSLNGQEYEVMELEEYSDDGYNFGNGQWIKGMSSTKGLDGNGYFMVEGGSSRLLKVIVDGETVYDAEPLADIEMTATPEGGDAEEIRYKLDGTIFDESDTGFYIQNGRIRIKK